MTMGMGWMTFRPSIPRIFGHEIPANELNFKFKKGFALRIQICPKKGINPTILLRGWDWDHQTYSREGYGSLGLVWLFSYGASLPKNQGEFG